MTHLVRQSRFTSGAKQNGAIRSAVDDHSLQNMHAMEWHTRPTTVSSVGHSLTCQVWSVDRMDLRVIALPSGRRVNSRTRGVESGPATVAFVFRSAVARRLRLPACVSPINHGSMWQASGNTVAQIHD